MKLLSPPCISFSRPHTIVEYILYILFVNHPAIVLILPAISLCRHPPIVGYSISYHRLLSIVWLPSHPPMTDHRAAAWFDIPPPINDAH